MDINFPSIEHMDDVIHEFGGRSEFRVLDRGSYFVIDYNYVDKDTFANDILREGRGLKFDSEGRIIGRPFHKFFNLGEKPESSPENLLWEYPINVETKHDGSMIHPVLIDGQIVLMTRKGNTDVAMQAERECDVPWDNMRKFLYAGITPMYEFVSPTNRIVVDYEKPELRFLAAREIVSGRYINFDTNPNRRKTLIGGDFSLDMLVDEVRNMKGEEGVVLVWPNGHRVKMKADEYVALHRNIDLSGTENRLLEVILAGNHDDLIPMLTEQRASAVTEYASIVLGNVMTRASEMESFVTLRDGVSQKEFAMEVNAVVPKVLRSAYFCYRHGGDAQQIMLDRYMKVLNKQKDVDEHRFELLNNHSLYQVMLNNGINT